MEDSSAFDFGRTGAAHSSAAPRALIAAFACLVAALIAAALYLYVKDSQLLLDRERERLEAVAGLKTSLLATWISEREADVVVSARGLGVTMRELWSDDRDPAKSAALVERLGFLCRAYGYEAAEIRDLGGRIVLAYPPAGPAGAASLDPRELAPVAGRRGRLSFAGDGPKGLSLRISSSLSASDQEPPRGYLVLTMNPERFVYGLLSGWPGKSSTAETLLLRVEGGVATFLGGFREAPAGTAPLRLPVAETVLAGLEDGHDGEGFVEGVDYRHQAVLASVRRVPGTPWILIAKIDRAEVLGPFVRGFRWTALLVTTILFVSLLLGIGVYARERRRMLATVARANQRFLALFDFAEEGVVLFDRAGRVLSANARAKEMFRVGKSEIEGQSISRFFKEAELEARPLRWGELEERVSLSAERHLTRLDGEPLIAHLQTVTLPDGRFLTIVHDHTERRAAEMRERRAKRMAKLGSWEWDLRGKHVHWDDETFQIYDYEPGRDVASREAWEARLHPEDRASVLESIREALEGGASYDREYRILLPDGRVRWVHAQGDVERDSSGVAVRFEGAIQNVTERHEASTALELARAHLAESQKAEAVGRLAGGIAHDFNNVVGIILGYSELVEMELAADHPARVHLGEIGAAGRRAAELTKRLLAFSRRQPVERRAVDIAGLLAEARGLLEPILGESIALELSAPVDVGAVLADAAEMSQMMVNLAAHARDAMPRGGRLSLVARAIEIDNATAQARPPLVAGPGIELSVEDDGPGMDETALRASFEPFSTARGPGVESGLGLWVVKRVVENSGGAIAVESTPGRGTRFRILLPAVRECTQEWESALATGELGRQERVLVVDDVAQMRSLAQSMLARAGFEVTTTESPEQALAWIEDPGCRFELMLTDIVMPRLDGRVLAKRALELRPELLVLFMTGYADLPAHEFPGSLPPECLIEKPFAGLTLARKVRALIDRRTPIASPGN